MAELALKVTALTKQFGGLAAVNDVSLQVARGTLHAVIGPNGAGKSTPIHLLSGDLSPTSGSVASMGVISHTSRRTSARVLALGAATRKPIYFPPLVCWRTVALPLNRVSRMRLTCFAQPLRTFRSRKQQTRPLTPSDYSTGRASKQGS